jgi:transcription initiation factor IIE alpha subunit
MNIETREIRDLNEITPAERASGKWIPVAKKYVKKQPISDEDYARIMAAEERRIRRALKRVATTHTED